MRRSARVVAAGVIAGLVGSMAPPTASATTNSPVDAGDVVVVDATNGSRELTHGGSGTVFSLRLPAGAACPGDSLHDQWRVQSFIVPAADDPGTLKYGVIAPDGDGRFVLYDVRGVPFIHILTRANSGTAEAGVIADVPALSFAVFKPGILQSGHYRIGIACTLFRETAKYWDAEVVITASPSDKPGQFVWRLANAPASVNDSQSGGPWLVPAIGALVAAALGWAVWQRIARKPRPIPASANTHRSPTFSKETK